MSWVINGNYLGIAFLQGGRTRVPGLDCWGLTRLVLKEQLGLDYPLYDDVSTPVGYWNKIIEEIRVQDCTPIGIDDVRAFDIAIMLTETKVDDRWTLAPIHMGVFVDESNILHIPRDMTSRVDNVSNRLVRLVQMLRIPHS